MTGRVCAVLGVLSAVLVGCGRERSRDGGDTPLVIAAVREPIALVPPLVVESVGRDISDQVYERLADLAPGGAPVAAAAYRPRLASAWERLDSLTWRFHLRPGARWHDGRPVTAEDVKFSFDAYADSTLGAPARDYLAGRVTVEVEDASTFRLRFAAPSPEQLYDATYHVRILPKHVWERLPRAEWAADTSLARLVGSGPYRIREWKRGQHLRLEADSLAGDKQPRIRRVLWRFAADPDAAINLVLSREADLLESVGGPSQLERFRGDTAVVLRPYPSATYTFLAFRIADAAGRPHPLFGNRELRRALVSAVDRPTAARALLGPETQAPPGPMSRLLWIWSDSIATLPYDSAAAAATLDRAGWRLASAVRKRVGKPLRFDILVPSSSNTRRQAAVMLQEQWRRLGAEVTVTAVEFPVFEERLRKGAFDTYIATYLDEPSPRGLADQWSRSGWDALNFGRYANPAFDSLFTTAGRTGNVTIAQRLYREAMDTLNADAPGVFLFAPSQTAAVSRRVEGVEINPYSWVSGLPAWRVE